MVAESTRPGKIVLGWERGLWAGGGGGGEGGNGWWGEWLKCCGWPWDLGDSEREITGTRLGKWVWTIRGVQSQSAASIEEGMSSANSGYFSYRHQALTFLK